MYFMLRQKILTPGIRPYRSENLYKQLEEKEKLRREVRYLEEKSKRQNRKAAEKAVIKAIAGTTVKVAVLPFQKRSVLYS